MFIPDPGSPIGPIRFFFIPNPRSWLWIFFHPRSLIRITDSGGQKSTGTRIRNTGLPYIFLFRGYLGLFSRPRGPKSVEWLTSRGLARGMHTRNLPPKKIYLNHEVSDPIFWQMCNVHIGEKIRKHVHNYCYVHNSYHSDFDHFLNIRHNFFASRSVCNPPCEGMLIIFIIFNLPFFSLGFKQKF